MENACNLHLVAGDAIEKQVTANDHNAVAFLKGPDEAERGRASLKETR